MNDPRATAQDVSNEMRGAIDASDVYDGWLQDAHALVEKRLSNERDEDFLKRIEAKVAAHFAYPSVTGDTDGKRVRKVKQGGRSVSFDTASTNQTGAPGGYGSPYWGQAMEMTDDRIETGEFWSHSLGR